MATRRKPVAPKCSESSLQRAIIDTLQARGVWCWRNNSGATATGSGKDRRFIQLSPKGSPDIFGVVPGGKLFGLEVKRPGEKQNENQIEWQKKAEQYGVFYAVVTSITQAIEAVKNAT